MTKEIGAFVVAPQPVPRVVLLLGRDSVVGEFGPFVEGFDPVEECERGGVPILAVEKRPGLAEIRFVVGTCSAGRR